MDIQHLVDRLEDLIDEGRHLFGTKYTMIDEERALELIDQMRISIPEEIEKSARIMQQRERIRFGRRAPDVAEGRAAKADTGDLDAGRTEPGDGNRRRHQRAAHAMPRLRMVAMDGSASSSGLWPSAE